MTNIEAKSFHAELVKTLEGLFEKYHLTRERSNVTYGDSSVRISVTCEQLATDGTHKSNPLTENRIRSTLNAFGVQNIPDTIVGAKIKLSKRESQLFTITGYNSRAPKYPIEIEGEDGKRYKHSGRGIRFV